MHIDDLYEAYEQGNYRLAAVIAQALAARGDVEAQRCGILL